jgi:hypothetical protein
MNERPASRGDFDHMDELSLDEGGPAAWPKAEPWQLRGRLVHEGRKTYGRKLMAESSWPKAHGRKLMAESSWPIRHHRVCSGDLDDTAM